MSRTFGVLLREHRARARLTQEQLAERSGVSVRTIGRFETGERRDPRMTSVRQLAEALPLSTQEREELFSGVYDEGDPGGPQLESVAHAGQRFLPLSVPDFTGRRSEMTSLVECVVPSAADDMAIVLIDGMAGVGKTTLAVHTAHAVADRYPDGQFFCDLNGFTPDRDPMGPDAALESLLRMAGVPGERIPETVDARAAAWRAAVAERRVLVVLDNVKEASQVWPLLPGSPGCLVLVTSRRRLLALPVVSVLSLGVFSAREAAALFATVAGPDRVADDPAAVDEIVGLCGYLPLAIRIAAARLAHRRAWSPTYLAEKLRHDRLGLTELDGSSEQGVAVAFTTSYQQLECIERRLFRLLGLNPGVDVAPSTAAALTGIHVAEAEALLERLVDHHLVLESAPGRYAFHDLLRHQARAAADAEETAVEQHKALSRLFDHYLYKAAVAIDLLIPHEKNHRPHLPAPSTPAPDFTDSDAAHAWLEAELANLVACTARAATSGWPTHATRISAILWRWLDDRAHFTNALKIHQHALDAARANSDPAGEADALRFLGTVYWRWARYDEAAEHHQQALTLARELGNRMGEARTLNNLGTVHQRLGRYDQAAEHHQQALRLFRELGARGSEGYVLNCLGNVYLRTGLHTKAAEFHERALVLFRELGDRTSEARTLYNLGNVHEGSGRYDQAAEHHQQALRLFRELGARGSEGYALNSIGTIYQRWERYKLAAEHHEHALAVARRVGERELETQALIGLGTVAHASGDAAGAQQHHESALAIALETGNRHDQAIAHENLGHAYQSLNHHNDARDHWQQALTIYGELGVPEAGTLRIWLHDHQRGDGVLD